MQTEDESSHPHHVVDVGEGDEHNGGQMMDEHHQEVLGRDGSQERACKPASVLPS